jgi:hypothetical protein
VEGTGINVLQLNNIYPHMGLQYTTKIQPHIGCHENICLVSFVLFPTSSLGYVNNATNTSLAIVPLLSLISILCPLNKD